MFSLALSWHTDRTMPLTRDQVVDTALRLLDDNGFAALSMRRIAGLLDVQPGALYYHVDSKQQLLTAVAERILTPVLTDGSADLPWPEALRAWADGLRTELLAHRDGAELVASVLALRPPELPLTALPAAILAAAGLPPDQAAAAARGLTHFVVGHCVDEQNIRQFAEVGVGAGMPAGDAEVFDYGVAVFIDGLAVRLAQVNEAGPTRD